MFMSSTLEASVFMGKNYSDNLHSIKNTGNNLSLKQIFNISEKLIIGQSDEIYGVIPINWEHSSWKQFSLVSDEEVISLSHVKVYVCWDSVLCVGKVNQNPASNTVWEEQVGQETLYLRALQGHSGRNPTDPSPQDKVSFPNNFFKYICHIGCAINLHSIANSGLIPGGQNSSKERQTVFFTAVNPLNKEHKDPYEIGFNALRLAWYKQKKWKRHQDTVYWVDIQLAQQKGFKFYQTRSNAIILYDTLPAHCIPKVVVMESGEITYEKVFASPRHTPKISKING